MSFIKSKEEKEEEKAKRLNLKMSEYNLENLSLEDKKEVSLILTGLMGNGLAEWGSIFSGNAEDTAKLSYMQALVEQNWLIIKLLNELKEKLETK